MRRTTHRMTVLGEVGAMVPALPGTTRRRNEDQVPITWAAAKRTVLTTALTAAALAGASVPSRAADTSAPTVTVTDRPGAPGDMLEQLGRQAGQPLGTLDKVVAIDTAGEWPTIDQLKAVMVGDDVEGATVLGVMPGSPRLLDTTMADLSDGKYEGPQGGGTVTSSVLFATADPDYGWCLTMCIANGKSVWQCMEASRTTTFALSGGATLAATKAALERANDVSLGDLEAVETLIGDGEPSTVDVQLLLLGKRVDSLSSAAVLERPDPSWTLADVAEKSGVMNAKTEAHVFTFTHPTLGKFLAVCISQDGGKNWKCTARQWSRF